MEEFWGFITKKYFLQIQLRSVSIKGISGFKTCTVPYMMEILIYV